MNRFRRWATKGMDSLRDALGAKCAQCGGSDELEFDCIIPQGDKHHKWETNRRYVFYKRQHEQKNLQLLCRVDHEKKSRGEQYWLWNQAPSPCQTCSQPNGI